MNIPTPPVTSSRFSRFSSWLESTPLGASLLSGEKEWFDCVSTDIFGYKAIQLQLPHIDLLRASRIPWRICVAEEAGGALRCEPHALPIQTQSLDLLALPHVLDFAEHPQAVLREVERVLMPEGRLLITGFNPWSLWAWRRFCKRDPWRANRLTLPRLKDWLALMGFEAMQGNYLQYTWPAQNAKWLMYTRWLNDAGDRWWPAAGAVYCLDVVKRVRGMRIITPRWKKAPVSTVPASDASYKANKVVGHE